MSVSSKWVLDASAVLALLGEESGSDIVSEAIVQGAVISAVNEAETMTKLIEIGVPSTVAATMIESLGVHTIEFDRLLAHLSAELRQQTKAYGLSLGDRACLALALHIGRPVLTADRKWQDLQLPIDIRLIR